MVKQRIHGNGKGFLNGNPPHQQERANKMKFFHKKKIKKDEFQIRQEQQFQELTSNYLEIMNRIKEANNIDYLMK